MMMLHSFRRGLSVVNQITYNNVIMGSSTIPRSHHLIAARASHSISSSNNKRMTSCLTSQDANSITQVCKIGCNKISMRQFNSQSSPSGSVSIVDVLEKEIQEETAELNQQLSTDQFPGFSVETDDADVKLTKQVGDATISVRFTVSSSLSEWPVAADGQPKDAQQQQQQEANLQTTLVSMPEFQVQVVKGGQTLEMSCYFEDMEQDEETGEPLDSAPIFNIDELVLYEGEPKETEFAVSAEYFPEDLQDGLLTYLAQYGIDEEFSNNLIRFATSYEKKQYVGLIQRLKKFVTK